MTEETSKTMMFNHIAVGKVPHLRWKKHIFDDQIPMCDG